MKHELFPYFYTQVLYSDSQFYWAHGFRTLSNWITNGLWFHVCRKLWVLGLIHNQQTKYDSIFSTKYEISYFFWRGFSLISLGLIIEFIQLSFLSSSLLFCRTDMKLHSLVAMTCIQWQIMRPTYASDQVWVFFGIGQI